MLKLENTEVLGWEHAIRGMRNPMNSWEKSDTKFYDESPEYRYEDCPDIGPNDLDLMKRLRNAGTDHRKFMRMITVYVDLTAPLYWWKEFDTYKVGTVANSCSTMHKIHAKEFALEDFSCEHLSKVSLLILEDTIKHLNWCREVYLENKDKGTWWQMIQLLPSSYNQRRTVQMNYEVLANIYKSRRNHKLDEWHTFCDWIEGLPYSELITGPDLKDIPICNQIMEEAKRRVHEELNTQWDKFYEMHSGHENVERAVFRIRREDVDAETWEFLMKATKEGKSFHIFEKNRPAVTEDIEDSVDISHLVDITCSWDVEELGGERIYAIGPGFTREDLTPYELYLLEKSEEYEKRKKEK